MKKEIENNSDSQQFHQYQTKPTITNYTHKKKKGEKNKTTIYEVIIQILA